MSIEKLLQIPKFGSGTGLHRMAWLCAELLQSAWGQRLDAIKITGSNGKGSTCAMTAAILRALDIGYGLYTSPHLLQFNERIVLDDAPIGDADLATAVDWFTNQQSAYQRLYPADTIGAFEAFTAVALHHFAQHQPDLLIAEAGIGGRYDPTRVIPGGVVGLTSVDLEHTQLLGDSLEQIAFDKADLCPAGGTLVVGQIEADLARRLRAYCQVRQINMVETTPLCQFENIHFQGGKMLVNAAIGDWHFADLAINLQGFHQLSNAAVAVLLVWHWLQRNRPDVDENRFKRAVYAGLDAVVWHGRFQKIASRPDIYIDVGHTPDAIQQLVQTVKAAINKPILLVTGVSYNKEAAKILSILLPAAQAVICTRAYHRGHPASHIYELVTSQAPLVQAYEVDEIETAVTLAQDLARKNDMTVLVAGGLFLAIEAMYALQGRDPQSLQFF